MPSEMIFLTCVSVISCINTEVCVSIFKYYATDIDSQGEIVPLFEMHLYSVPKMYLFKSIRFIYLNHSDEPLPIDFTYVFYT